MERMMNTAKWLDRLFLAGMILMAVQLTVTVLFSLYAAAPSAGADIRYLQALGIQVETSSTSASNHGNTIFGIYLGYTAVLYGAFFWGLAMVRGILKPMKQGLPLHRSVSKKLRSMGILVLVFGFLYTAFDMVGKNLILRHLLPSEGGSLRVSVVHSNNLLVFLVAALLFLFSYIFRYGEELQTLSDETL